MADQDEEGYLVDPADWTEDWAERVASNQGISLCDDHWFVIRFMRELQQEHQVTPDARFVMRQLELRYPGQGRRRLFELFPYGYVAQACRMAGMRRPRAWSTG
jgi:TusE/DsrC/DsvC family sulfur relay protein